ncbi:tRNA1Val (adenine37-N6)-methyltransferase [Gillisia mitskevichiae]|uniref:tRNA1(Val) (adenine(37)-N6)-methyltransferase n=1 Tax=Gillisia mitskevichiae TaxID=270921 RepID=A0A495PZB3_9FLAO|nr:methyltransferase [Gillisia mitskevichiae]RKS55863.1 tRNA1Val (adenine37-N6)-methyltransferase [Gillisia mitskevichiae]
METPFRFKEFSVAQDKCAMKIGTDGVLLGAWTPISAEVNSILDIGAGTGIIALMLAQRSFAETIDALEIDEDAYEQAVENFENSPWGDRMFCYHAGFDEFVEEMQDEKYDLIVSNPPFFANTSASEITTSREAARSQASLPFEELLHGVSQLLSENGIFSIVIPKEEETTILEIASSNKLYPNKITEVKGTKTAKVKRSLITFQFLQKEIEKEVLILEESRHNYTPEYKKMVAPFYLKL